MNDSKAELVVTDPADVTCPTCGQQVTGYESSRATRQKVNRYEAWEGGPLLEVPTKQVEYEPDGGFVTTLDPCGHHVSRIVWRRDPRG